MTDASPETLDEAALSSLAAVLEEDFAEVISLYLQKTPELIKDIAKAYEAHNLIKAAEAAHTIKGSSSNLGLNRMVLLGSRLEDLLREEEPEPSIYDALYNQVAEEYTLVQKCLLQYCRQHHITL